MLSSEVDEPVRVNLTSKALGKVTSCGSNPLDLLTSWVESDLMSFVYSLLWGAGQQFLAPYASVQLLG